MKETFYYSLSKAIPGVLGFISVVLFMRIVGAQQYGQYSLLLSQCNLIVAIGIGWLNQAQLRYYSIDSDHVYFIRNQFLAFIYSVIICLIIMSIINYYQNFSNKIWVISILAIISIGAFNYLKTFYQAKLLPKKIIFLNSLQSILSIIFPLGLMIFWGKQSHIILLGVSLSFFFSIIIFSNNYLKKLPFKILKNKKSNKKFSNLFKWLRYGTPLSLWFAFGMALPFLDRYYINYYLQNEQLGIYSSLQEILVRSFSLTLFPITMALHPRIMKLWNSSKINDAIQLIIKSFYLILSIGLAIMFIVWYYNDAFFLLIKTLIPQFKIESKKIILPLLSAGLLWQISFLTHKMLELKEQTIFMIIAIIPSLIINIIGNNIFLSEYGILATAYAAFFSALAYCILTGIHFIYFVKKYRLL